MKASLKILNILKFVSFCYIIELMMYLMERCKSVFHMLMWHLLWCRFAVLQEWWTCEQEVVWAIRAGQLWITKRHCSTPCLPTPHHAHESTTHTIILMGSVHSINLLWRKPCLMMMQSSFLMVRFRLHSVLEEKWWDFLSWSSVSEVIVRKICITSLRGFYKCCIFN